MKKMFSTLRKKPATQEETGLTKLHDEALTKELLQFLESRVNQYKEARKQYDGAQSIINENRGEETLRIVHSVKLATLNGNTFNLPTSREVVIVKTFTKFPETVTAYKENKKLLAEKLAKDESISRESSAINLAQEDIRRALTLDEIANAVEKELSFETLITQLNDAKNLIEQQLNELNTEEELLVSPPIEQPMDSETTGKKIIESTITAELYLEILEAEINKLEKLIEKIKNTGVLKSDFIIIKRSLDTINTNIPKHNEYLPKLLNKVKQKTIIITEEAKIRAQREIINLIKTTFSKFLANKNIAKLSKEKKIEFLDSLLAVVENWEKDVTEKTRQSALIVKKTVKPFDIEEKLKEAVSSIYNGESLAQFSQLSEKIRAAFTLESETNQLNDSDSTPSSTNSANEVSEYDEDENDDVSSITNDASDTENADAALDAHNPVEYDTAEGCSEKYYASSWSNDQDLYDTLKTQPQPATTSSQQATDNTASSTSEKKRPIPVPRKQSIVPENEASLVTESNSKEEKIPQRPKSRPPKQEQSDSVQANEEVIPKKAPPTAPKPQRGLSASDLGRGTLNTSSSLQAKPPAKLPKPGKTSQVTTSSPNL